MTVHRSYTWVHVKSSPLVSKVKVIHYQSLHLLPINVWGVWLIYIKLNSLSGSIHRCTVSYDVQSPWICRVLGCAEPRMCRNLGCAETSDVQNHGCEEPRMCRTLGCAESQTCRTLGCAESQTCRIHSDQCHDSVITKMHYENRIASQISNK